MMKVSILGFSNGCDCIDSSNTSILVQTEQTSILIDVSGSPRMALLKANADILSLDAVLITHAHIDHLYAFPSLIHSLWLVGRTKDLIVAGNENSIKTCKHFFEYFSLDKKVRFNIKWENQNINSVGDINIQSFSLFHRKTIEVNGYTFTSNGKKFSYFPDSVAKRPFPTCSYSSDLLIHEAGGLDKDKEKINESHTTALQAAYLAKEIDAKNLILIHIPEDERIRELMLSEAKTIFINTQLPKISSIII